MAGPTRGNAGGPACSAPARKAVTARDRARAPTRPSSRVTVLAHGAARLPSGPVRAPSAASSPWPACPIQAVMSAGSVLPCSIAVTTSPSTQGREWRRPRAPRGSGTSARQSRTLPPAAARSSATRSSSSRRAWPAAARSRSASESARSRLRAARRSCSASRRRRARPPRAARRSRRSSRSAARRTVSSASAITASAAPAGAGMRDWPGNGASWREKGAVRCPLSYPRPRCPVPGVTRPSQNPAQPGNSPSPKLGSGQPAVTPTKVTNRNQPEGPDPALRRGNTGIAPGELPRPTATSPHEMRPEQRKLLCPQP